MIFTRNLLNNYIDISSHSDEEIVTALTSLGFEVASVKPLCEGTNLIIGEVVAKKQHPNAEKLSVCEVNIGKTTNQIVCGAPNVAVGQKVIVALEGSQLPIGLTIKKTIIRGEESNGMICSLKEIGFPEELIDEVNAQGIYAIEKQGVKVGDENPLQTLLFADSIFELEITPNRPDAWSLIALAKELGVYFDKKPHDFKVLPLGEQKETKITLSDACSFVALSKINNIENVPLTPYEMKLYLQLLGFNLQGFLVDVSNFVLIETGQPTHFYDTAKLQEKDQIKVEQNKTGNFLALNKQQYQIMSSDLVITNGGKMISLAGIMGGQDDIITPSTKEIIIETAIFDKTIIRKTAKRLNLSSYAAANFSKGRNKEYALLAIQRIFYYLKKYLPTINIEPSLIDDKVQPLPTIECDFNKVRHHLGIDISDEKIKDILQKLGCKVNGSKVNPSLERLDLLKEEDLWEEIARVYGYENIPTHLNPSLPGTTPDDEMYNFISKIKSILTKMGSFETKTYALTSEKKYCDFTFNCQKPLQLETFVAQNKTTMRQSVIPSLIEVCQYNFNHKVSGVNIFEVSRLYSQGDEEIELGLLHFGKLIHQELFKKKTTACFYTIKGYLKGLLTQLNIPLGALNLKPMTQANDFYNYHATCEIYIKGQLVGYFGEVNSFYLPKWKGEEIYVMQLDLKKLLPLQNIKVTYQPFSRFPIVSQDFTFEVQKDYPYSEVIKAFRRLKLPFRYQFELIDVYLDKAKKDLKALTITFDFINEKQTLNDEEISFAREAIKKIIVDFKGLIKD